MEVEAYTVPWPAAGCVSPPERTLATTSPLGRKVGDLFDSTDLRSSSLSLSRRA